MSQTPRPNILVVEDSEDLARALVENLTLEGYQVQAVADGHQALSTMVDSAPDLVLLDVMLPGTDGYSVLRAARKQGYAGLVLMLTARGTESDKVRGLRGGADDYVT
ncbi:MAG: response regulator, partial [Xanthomonadales bacterium]|nr:response regulator [Xanthomonadales bacterium]